MALPVMVAPFCCPPGVANQFFPFLQRLECFGYYRPSLSDIGGQPLAVMMLPPIWHLRTGTLGLAPLSRSPLNLTCYPYMLSLHGRPSGGSTRSSPWRGFLLWEADQGLRSAGSVGSDLLGLAASPMNFLTDGCGSRLCRVGLSLPDNQVPLSALV